MPKIFSEEERELLEKSIVAAAREEFWKRGFKKTSITAITGKVGIAAGTFYNFFNSKEMVFFRILEDILQVREDLLSLFSDDGDPVTELHRYLTECFAYMNIDPFFEIFYREKVHTRIMEKMPQEDLQRYYEHDLYCVAEILKRFQAKGYLQTMSVEELRSHFATLHMSVYHKEEIGIVDVSRYMDQQITILVNGLRYIH